MRAYLTAGLLLVGCGDGASTGQSPTPASYSAQGAWAGGLSTQGSCPSSYPFSYPFNGETWGVSISGPNATIATAGGFCPGPLTGVASSDGSTVTVQGAKCNTVRTMWQGYPVNLTYTITGGTLTAGSAGLGVNLQVGVYLQILQGNVSPSSYNCTGTGTGAFSAR